MQHAEDRQHHRIASERTDPRVINDRMPEILDVRVALGAIAIAIVSVAQGTPLLHELPDGLDLKTLNRVRDEVGTQIRAVETDRPRRDHHTHAMVLPKE